MDALNVASWIEILATAPESRANELSVLMGFSGRLSDGNNAHTLVAPIEGVREVRFFTTGITVDRIDLTFEWPVDQPTYVALSAESDPWVVTVEPTLDATGKMTALGLSRRSRGPGKVGVTLAYKLLSLAAPYAADAACAVDDAEVLDLRRCRINEAATMFNSGWLRNAQRLSLQIEAPGFDRRAWSAWAQLTHDAVHERIGADDAVGFELGRLASAVIHQLYRVEAGLEATLELSISALCTAMRETGSERIISQAEHVENAMHERLGPRINSMTPSYGTQALHRVAMAVRGIEEVIGDLEVLRVTGPPTAEESALERQIIAEPSDIELRLRWSKLARARNDPRGREILSLHEPEGGRSEGRRADCEPLWALGAGLVEFFAGFASSADIDITNLIKNADALFNAAPLTSLTITGVLGDQLEALLQIEQLKQLRSLQVVALEIDDAGLIRLLGVAPNVTSLDLDGSRLTETGRAALRARQLPFVWLRIDGQELSP